MKLISSIIALSFCISPACQTVFTKLDGTGGPVHERGTDPGAWDFYSAADAEVILYQDTLRMWYTGSDTTDALPQIGYAWSLYGKVWNEIDSVVVPRSTTGGFDSGGVETVSVLIDESAPAMERFKMWYAGTQNTFALTLYESIGYATSPNGIDWTKQGQVMLADTGNINSYENIGIEGPTVIKDGDVYKMWYAALPCDGTGPCTGLTAIEDSMKYHLSVMYATSPDGITWTKNADPVMWRTSGGWDSLFVQDPRVLQYGGKYHMWYSGTADIALAGPPGCFNSYHFRVGYAVSDDGLSWTKETSPILGPGTAGAWDDASASFPALCFQNDTLKMWYTGINENLNNCVAPYYWDQGYAFSSDFVTLNEDQKTRISIYPNPARGMVFLEGLSEFPSKYYLYSLTGTLCKKGEISSTNKMIDITNCVSGIYLLYIEDVNRSVPTKIFKL